MFESTNLDQSFLCALVIKRKLTRNLDLHHTITLTLILVLSLTFLIPQTLILSHHETPLTPTLTLVCFIFHDVPISQDLNTWCYWKSILTTISPIQNIILWSENYSFFHNPFLPWTLFSSWNWFSSKLYYHLPILHIDEICQDSHNSIITLPYFRAPITHYIELMYKDIIKKNLVPRNIKKVQIPNQSYKGNLAWWRLI